MSIRSRLLAFASQAFPRLSSRVLASSGYTLDVESFGPDAFRVWDRATAERQDRSWAPLVAQALAGHPRDDVLALYAALESVGASARSLLEVGCGGGYNSELIAHRVPALHYTGIDLSDSMVAISREKYPQLQFSVGSALALPFADGAFDTVLDGVALLHIPDWRGAIGEYARVASRHVILHGLTLSEEPTVTFAKYAYGQPSRELIFNRAELLRECEQRGLRLRSSHSCLNYDLADHIGISTLSETWVFSL